MTQMKMSQSISIFQTYFLNTLKAQMQIKGKGPMVLGVGLEFVIEKIFLLEKSQAITLLLVPCMGIINQRHHQNMIQFFHQLLLMPS